MLGQLAMVCPVSRLSKPTTFCWRLCCATHDVIAGPHVWWRYSQIQFRIRAMEWTDVTVFPDF